METTNIARRLRVWAVIVGLLLMVPFLAMQFSWQVIDPGSPVREEVNWTLGDFVFAGVLLFGSATVYELLARKTTDTGRKILIGLGVFAVLAFIWAGAATGFEGIIDRLG